MATKKTTGRFDTRQQLVERVCLCVDRNSMSMEKAGKSCGISAATASKIYHGEEGQAYREIAAAQVVDDGMKVVDELVENPPERHELDTIESEGKTYQVDLMAHSPQFQKFEIAKRVAHTLANSNLVPDAYRGRPNDVFVAINMGSELGMEPFQAIQSIAVIEGKPCLYGDGLIGVVRASPKCMWIKETLSDDGKTATCETQRKDDPHTISATYSMSDAVQAGIDTKFNWKKHPKRMLQMRSRAYCLRDAYPDLLKGLGVVEEHQDHDDTPPPVTQYDLPKATGGEQLESRPAIDAQPETTLAQVERAINQSDSMEELLAAGALAKNLSDQEQTTARITYKKMRTVLKETPQ